jgi:hypothetical protein
MHRTDNTGIASSRVILRSNDDWHTLPSSPDVAFTAPCDESHCTMAGRVHVLCWGDIPNHKAFSWSSDPGCLVEVVRYPLETDSSAWSVEGFLHDDDRPLTPDRVKAFMANYNSAVALAAELNGEVA